jgi:hypothetical protein
MPRYCALATPIHLFAPSFQVQEEGDDVWEPDQLLAALKSELLEGGSIARDGEQDERCVQGGGVNISHFGCSVHSCAV